MLAEEFCVESRAPAKVLFAPKSRNQYCRFWTRLPEISLTVRDTWGKPPSIEFTVGGWDDQYAKDTSGDIWASGAAIFGPPVYDQYLHGIDNIFSFVWLVPDFGWLFGQKRL